MGKKQTNILNPTYGYARGVTETTEQQNSTIYEEKKVH